MKIKFKILSILLGGSLMVSLVGCQKSEQKVAEDGLFPIRVVTQTGFNEINVADELGFFKDEGIKIEYTGVLGQGVTEFQLLEQGINDAFVGSHPPSVAQARLAGVKVKIVAPGMVDNPDFPHVRYLVQKDSPITSLDQIAGKKVAISATGPCLDGYLKYYMKKNNIKGDVEWVTLSKPGQEEQSLDQGLIEVTTSHPPYAGKELSSGNARQIATSWDILHSPGAGLSCRGFTEDFIAKHPDQVQGFVNAMYKARVWINSHQDEAKKIVAKFLNLEPDDLSVFWYDEEKSINPEYINEWYGIAEDIGLWKHGDITQEEIYTNDFVPKDYNVTK
jgi:sulfonate transport system substrate-binding protein